MSEARKGEGPTEKPKREMEIKERPLKTRAGRASSKRGKKIDPHTREPVW